MYRRTKRYEQNRKLGPRGGRSPRDPQDYPPDLPHLRRVIVVIDYDFGPRIHTMRLYRSGRVDQYLAFADGKPWQPDGQKRVGWSRVLAGMRKGMPRVMGPRNYA